MAQKQQQRRRAGPAARASCAIGTALWLLAAAPASAVTPAVAQPVQNTAASAPSTLVGKTADNEPANPVSPGVALLLAALAVALYLGSRGSRD